MSTKRLVTWAMTIGTAFVGTVRSTAAAATLHVPGDFAAIQACIDAAVSGVDECVVAPGTYHETINFLGKAITVRSSDGAAVTTIDATGLGGSVVTCTSGEELGTVVDGLTVTGGTGTYLAILNSYVGGGMYNSGSSPTVANCTIRGNTATIGGGMFSHNSSSPTVANCTFSANTADFWGGGMFNRGSSAKVTNCTFSGNTTSAVGGGMFNFDSNPVVTNCTFNGNAADYGGGMSNWGGNSLVTNCTFNGNTAAYGGGMVNDSGSATVTGCAFIGNSATDDGGGMYSYVASPTVTNCTFSANTGATGDGMYISFGSPTVTNCILWGDGANEVVNNELGTPAIGFSDVQGGLPVGAVDGGGNIDLEPMFVRPPNPGPDGTWDGVDDDYGDLGLQAGSPCIDTGDPALVVQPGETDLEGHARVLCGRVDMGAYEFGIGDYDCDQVVDLADFSSWQACMTGPLDSGAFHSTIDIRQSTIGCESFDFDGDGSVSLLDFGGFQRVFAP